MDYQYNEQQTESYFIVFYTNCHNGNRSGFYENGDNTFSEYQVGFCGYFPTNKPKYSMIVSMNKLGLPASGGGMAGSLFHDIVEWMIKHDIPSPLWSY